MNFAGNTRLKDYISMKKFFNIIPGEDACCILLYGDIGDYDGNVRSGDIARELLEAEALSGRIDVRINSNGGEVYAGIAIFNALKNSKADITIYVDGIAASMASVIALCGKPVQMSRYARLMLHSVQGGCYGNKEEMRGCIREIESLEDTLCEMYAARMGKDKVADYVAHGAQYVVSPDMSCLMHQQGIALREGITHIPFIHIAQVLNGGPFKDR